MQFWVSLQCFEKKWRNKSMAGRKTRYFSWLSSRFSHQNNNVVFFHFAFYKTLHWAKQEFCQWGFKLIFSNTFLNKKLKYSNDIRKTTVLMKFLVDLHFYIPSDKFRPIKQYCMFFIFLKNLIALSNAINAIVKVWKHPTTEKVLERDVKMCAFV